MPIPAIIAGLLKAGLPILASAVMSKGQNVIQEKLGVDIGGLLGSEEGRLKLKALEFEHEVNLRKLAGEAGERELRSFQAEVEDRKSARETNAKIAVSEESGVFQRNLMPGMAVLITIGFFGCMGALFYVSITGTKLDDNSRDVLIYAFGAMTTGWMSIVNFIFGSSRGSRDNQAMLAKIAGAK